MFASAIKLLQHIFAEAGMARQTGRAALVLSGEYRTMLSELAGSRTAAQREIKRAKVLLAYAEGNSPTQIQYALGVSRPTIYKCIDKALAAGAMTGLHARYHRATAPQISEAQPALRHARSNRTAPGGRRRSGRPRSACCGQAGPALQRGSFETPIAGNDKGAASNTSGCTSRPTTA